MAFTQNFNSDTFGPIQWKLMGPIADRPATADLHTTYLSTDEGDGVLKAYLYTESGWMQMQGIEGFTGGGGGSGGDGVFTINFTTDDEWTTIEADKTYAETLTAINSGNPVYAVAIETYDDVTYTDTLACITATDESISFTAYVYSTDEVNHHLWLTKFEYLPDSSVVRTQSEFALTPA